MKMGLIETLLNKLSFGEFKKSIASRDTKKIVDLLETWGRKYFKVKWKEYLDEVRMFLVNIVQEIGRRIR